MFYNQLRRSESKILGFIVLRVFLKIAKMINLQQIPSYLIKVMSLSQASDPLRGKTLPTIDVAIPCHMKDFDNLSLVIRGAKACVRNPIGKVKLITPEYSSMELQTKFPDCLVLTDESVLSADIVEVINELVPKERRGWMIQQIIKFQMAMTSDQVATLIIDADTILLRPKIWLNSQGTQILCISEEYHPPYKKHLRKVFGGQKHLLSFTTHYQLMKRDSIREIFGCDSEGLIRWLKLGDYSEDSPTSDYETYGEWMVMKNPDQVVFAKWNNVPVSLNLGNASYVELVNEYSKYDSVSNHSYLQQ